MTLHDDAQDEEVMSQINITPLTDCMMVLLIIFMIASTALSQTGFNIQLPRVSTNEESMPSQIVISVAQNGDIFVGAHRVAPEKLEGYLAKLAAAKRCFNAITPG